MRSDFFLLWFIWVSAVSAQWSHDPTVNTVLDKAGDQRAPLITTDGKLGAIVAWDEDRGVFANRIDKFGFRKWGNEGIRITPLGRLAALTNITSDGLGGVVIVWEDLTHARQVGGEVVRIIENEIFAQRVDSLGQLIWDPSGVAVRIKIDSSTVGAFKLVASGLQEFIVFWTDDRNHVSEGDVQNDFYAQKIDLEGNQLWGVNGKLITVNGSLINTRSRIATDGAGGFLLARFGEGQQNTVVERISADGDLMWQPGGVPVHTGGAFEMASDEQSGAVVAGVFFPGGGGTQVGQTRVQRINSNGELIWGDNATILMDEIDKDSTPRIVSDGNSGAIIYWDAKDSDDERKGFLQHINHSGTFLWSPRTVRFNVTSTIHPIFISDQKNGMILLAIDFFGTSEGQFWGVRADFTGNLVWGEQGVLFRRRPFNDWPFYFDAVADGSGGFIAAWEEFNNTSSWDIVLQQVNARGEIGVVITSVDETSSPVPPKEYALFQNYPNPFNPETRIRFAIKESGVVSLKIYDLSGREVITLYNQKLSAGEHQVSWDGKDSSKKQVASGIYFYQLRVNQFQAIRKMLYIR